MMCYCWFTLGNKCTMMLNDTDNGESYVCEKVQDIWEISVPSSQLCYEPKTALKNEVFKKKKYSAFFFKDE